MSYEVCVCGHKRGMHWGDEGQSNCTVEGCECWYFLMPESDDSIEEKE
jgi:hypothetical protein